jgi:hypothetical protein
MVWYTQLQGLAGLHGMQSRQAALCQWIALHGILCIYDPFLITSLDKAQRGHTTWIPSLRCSQFPARQDIW